MVKPPGAVKCRRWTGARRWRMSTRSPTNEVAFDFAHDHDSSRGRETASDDDAVTADGKRGFRALLMVAFDAARRQYSVSAPETSPLMTMERPYGPPVPGEVVKDLVALRGAENAGLCRGGGPRGV